MIKPSFFVTRRHVFHKNKNLCLNPRHLILKSVNMRLCGKMYCCTKSRWLPHEISRSISRYLFLQKNLERLSGSDDILPSNRYKINFSLKFSQLEKSLENQSFRMLGEPTIGLKKKQQNHKKRNLANYSCRSHFLNNLEYNFHFPPHCFTMNINI